MMEEFTIDTKKNQVLLERENLATTWMLLMRESSFPVIHQDGVDNFKIIKLRIEINLK